MIFENILISNSDVPIQVCLFCPQKQNLEHLQQYILDIFLYLYTEYVLTVNYS